MTNYLSCSLEHHCWV
uniref:Uncharacterized protein n=1 Tax=Anguilla anguilla TaxID=7936 RepID=A0A0E9RU68_ANGAN